MNFKERILLFIRRIHQFHNPTSRITGWPGEQHPGAGILFSAGVHILVVVMVLISPFIGSRTPIMPEVYQVELVNVVPGTPAPPPAVVPSRPVKVKVATRTQPAPIPRRAVSLKPIRSRLLKEARNLEEADQRQLEARLARLQHEAEAERLRQQAREEADRAVDALARSLRGEEKETTEQPGIATSPGDRDQEESRETRTGAVSGESGIANVISAGYLSRLGALIQRNWILPDLQKKWPRDMQAKIRVSLTPDGRIENLTFIKRARDFRFNVQAEKALRRSSPFPPPPPEIAAEATQIVLTFTPEEVR